jgi:Tn3 transposase DDE domain
MTAQPDPAGALSPLRALQSLLPAADGSRCSPGPGREVRSGSVELPPGIDRRHRYGLVVNVIVLWNTIYMDAALNQLRDEGFDVSAEDAARLSPLGFDHVNMLGRYAFILPDGIARGELRPLRDPRHADEEG